jgi:hypothetical protein
VINFYLGDPSGASTPKDGLGEGFLLWLWDTAARLRVSIPNLRSLDVYGDNQFPGTSGEAAAFAFELQRLREAIERADPESLPALDRAWRYEHQPDDGTLTLAEALTALREVEGLLRMADETGETAVGYGD